jgi:large subunit ribosomal protein L18
MADKNKVKAAQLQRRKWRVRNTVHGTAQRPRLSVYRSSKHISAQLIDDISGRTLAAASSASKELRGDLKTGGNIAAARVIGQAIAQRGMSAGIKDVCFDRGGRSFHGRVKALADAARKAGLKF